MMPFFQVASTIKFYSPKYDKMTRTFTGVIDWPDPFKGADRSEWTLIFSEDLKTIEAGSKIVSFKIDGQMCDQRDLYPGDYMLLE